MNTLTGLALTVVVLTGCSSTRPAPVVDASRPAPRDGAPAVSVVRPSAPAMETPAATYTVKKGDTLYSIALEHGQDYRELAQWNGLSDPNRIQVGQVLRVLPPDSGTAAAPAAGVASVQPVAAPAPLQVRPLSAGAQAATGTTAAVSANSETMKREPKGGKVPYSEQTLAQVRNEATQPATQPVPAAGEKPAAGVVTATAATVTPAAASPAQTPAAAPTGGAASTTAAQTPAAAEPDAVEWGWPLAANAGRIVGNFSDGSAGKEANKGIDLAARPGEPVLAAAAGKVVYAGSGLRGYGQLVIVRHNATWLSAYAHNRKILVKEGQMVARGERIAEVGNTDADQFKLHFEIRRQGKPVDPLKYLPPR